MTIEIHQPELEALIREQMQRGHNVEDILMRAYRMPPADRAAGLPDWRTMRGMARGGGSLTQALIEDRAAENARDQARVEGR